MAVELTVSLKGEDSTYKQKFLLYDTFQMKHDDKTILDCIREAKENARMEVEDIKIRALIQVK